MPPSARGACAYIGVAAAVAVPLLLPATPGTVPFFLLHCIAYALANVLLSVRRRRAWEVAGMPEGPSWRPDWAEPFPAWTFEVTFLMHLVDLPLALAMAAKVCSGAEAFHSAATLRLRDLPASDRYGPSLFWEHYIFATHSGVFLGDFALYYSRPDLLYLVHHLCSIFLFVVGSFWDRLPGFSLAALCTALLEIGSMAYCAWALWETRKFYLWTMNLSNAIYFACILCIQCKTGMPPIFLVLGAGLIAGRTWHLKNELCRRKKSV